MKQVEYGLEGAFKVDLFSGGQMTSTTDWFSNFITPTGLLYPTGYAFADCFRFLSLGSDASANQGSQSASSLGTTGLVTAIEKYFTSEGKYQGAQYIDWRGYATGLTSSNCGTVVSSTGPRFFRAWTIPTGAGDITVNEPSNGLTIGEIMVSPGSGGTAGQFAFSRIARNLTIPNGFRAVISYQLKINIKNTGLSYLPPNSFRTTDAETSNPVEAAIVSRWANLSGVYRQVNFGLRAIDVFGRTYIPKFGDGMEPSSRNLRKMVWYLSPDNSQFDTSAIGVAPTTEAQAYAADGLMANIGSNQLSITTFNSVATKTEDFFSTSDFNTITKFYTDDNPSVETYPTDAGDADELFNIRIGRAGGSLALPKLSDYKNYTTDAFHYQSKADVSKMPISYATPGTNGWSTSESDFGKLAVFASNTVKVPFGMIGNNTITGRKKTLSRKSTFSPISSLGYNTRFGTMVYAFEANESAEDATSKKYYPMIDCMFIDSSGQYLLPHYRMISGIYLTDRGSGVLGSSLSIRGRIDNAPNIRKFISWGTFQGPYNSEGLRHYLPLNDDAFSLFNNTGFLLSGQSLNSNLLGDTGNLTIGPSGGFTGWGGVYGLVVNDAFKQYSQEEPDLLLVKHTTGRLSPPPQTGTGYWPYVAPENKIWVKVDDVKYWDPGLGTAIFNDTSLWFGTGKQIISDVVFERLDNSYNVLPRSTNPTSITGYTGWVLTSKVFDNAVVSAQEIVGAGKTFTFKGYVFPKPRNTVGQLKGITWEANPSTPPTDNLFFTPLFSTLTIDNYAPSFSAVNVTGLFADWSDRGYPNGTGGSPINPNYGGHIIFTGYSGSDPTKNPLYLTYVSGKAGNVYGHSYVSGTVQYTNFAPPTGHPYHVESVVADAGYVGYKLATNFDSAQPWGGDSIYTATTGGEYPALSLDNGLEIYLDITWSSPCGPSTTNCNEPPA
jgi:hypothetical protein